MTGGYAGFAGFDTRERERRGMIGDWRTGGAAAVCTRSRCFSASHRTSGTLPGHLATGSSLLVGLGGSFLRIISFRFRAPGVRSGCKRDFRDLLPRGRFLLRSPRVAATGCNWASCSESSGGALLRNTGILAVPCQRSSKCSAVLPDFPCSRPLGDLLSVVSGGVPLPVLSRS